MAYTRHGHHIRGSNVGLPFIGKYVLCGGVRYCGQCKIDFSMYHHPSNTNNETRTNGHQDVRP